MIFDPASEPREERLVVTIVMPSFNAARTIGRAIDSVVAQTFLAWRLICVDDASTDGTSEVLDSYRRRLGRRITIHRLPHNGGPAKARNHGLETATGTWITVIDADDAWHPRRLEQMVDLAIHSRADAVCDNLMGFDDHRQTLMSPLFTTLPSVLTIGMVVAAEYQGRYNLGYLKPMLRRAFVETHRLRYDEALRTGEDLLFLLSCLVRGGRVVCHDAPTYIYTTPVGQDSRKLSRSTRTSPRDADLALALQKFINRHAGVLGAEDCAAVRRRIAYLTAIAPLSTFRHARLNRDWRSVLRLICVSSEVRRRIWSALGLERRRPPGTRA